MTYHTVVRQQQGSSVCNARLVCSLWHHRSEPATWHHGCWVCSQRQGTLVIQNLPEKPYTANRNWHFNIRVCTFTLWSASGVGAWSCDVYVADDTTATYFKTSWYQVPQICRWLSAVYNFWSNIPGDRERAVVQMEACVQEIRQCMAYRWLKLNDEKTEMVVFTS